MRNGEKDNVVGKDKVVPARKHEPTNSKVELEGERKKSVDAKERR
jgi:hypothetical protein